MPFATDATWLRSAACTSRGALGSSFPLRRVDARPTASSGPTRCRGAPPARGGRYCSASAAVLVADRTSLPPAIRRLGAAGVARCSHPASFGVAGHTDRLVPGATRPIRRARPDVSRHWRRARGADVGDLRGGGSERRPSPGCGRSRRPDDRGPAQDVGAGVPSAPIGVPVVSNRSRRPLPAAPTRPAGGGTRSGRPRTPGRRGRSRPTPGSWRGPAACACSDAWARPCTWPP